MKEIKLKIVDDCGLIKPQILAMQERFKDKYKFIFSEDEPDYLFGGVFGQEHLKYKDCVKVFFNLENVRINFNLYDYAIGFDYLEAEDMYLRGFYVMLSFMQGQYRELDLHQKMPPSSTMLNDFIRTSKAKPEKKHFCSLIQTYNYNTSPREMFFDKLSHDYKQVTSAGAWRNNIGGVPKELGEYGRQDSLVRYISSFKFHLAFDNSSYPGYLCEKIFTAFRANTVPIYWGDTSLRCGFNLPQATELKEINQHIPNINPELIDYKINPKAFINAHNFATWDELIEEIKRLDNDDAAYEAMLNEPVFLEDKPLKYYEDKFFNFFDNIFAQPKELAYRRSYAPRTEQNYQFAINASLYPSVNAENKRLKPFEKEALELRGLKEEIESLPFKISKQELENLRLDEGLKKLEIKRLEKELGLKLSKLEPRVSLILNENLRVSAVARVRNHLAYRLGSAIIICNKSLWGMMSLPFVLSFIKAEYKKEQKAYQTLIKQRPELKFPRIETYRDYNESLKVKEHLSYKLGEALMRADKAWYKFGFVKFYFEAKRLEKEFKKKKR